MALRTLLIASWLLLAGPAGAGEPAPAAAAGPTLGLLDPATSLVPPPAPGALAALADLEAVLQAQAWRSPEQEAWARRIDGSTLWDFADVLGQGFASDRLPALEALVRQVEAEARTLSRRAKALHPRLRPPATDPRVRPCLEVSRDRSYPSGHALMIHLHAEILADVFPEHRKALEAWAERAAWSRVLGGAHFPSDVVAGRQLALAAAGELRRQPAYATALGRCRAEAEALRLKKAG